MGGEGKARVESWQTKRTNIKRRVRDLEGEGRGQEEVLGCSRYFQSKSAKWNKGLCEVVVDIPMDGYIKSLLNLYRFDVHCFNR